MGFSEWRLKATAKGCMGCRGYSVWIWVPMDYIYAMEYPRTISFSRRDGEGFVPPDQPAACNTSQSNGRCGLEHVVCFLFWRLS